MTGTENISSSVVPHGSTLIIGQSSTLTTTVTFLNSQTTTTFNDIVKTGTVSNPTIQGSSNATLIIDGTTVNFYTFYYARDQRCIFRGSKQKINKKLNFFTKTLHTRMLL